MIWLTPKKLYFSGHFQLSLHLIELPWTTLGVRNCSLGDSQGSLRGELMATQRDSIRFFFPLSSSYSNFLDIYS